MSEYITLGSAAVPRPFGLNNTGAICWWNSLTQTLLSLPAFSKVLEEVKDDVKENPLATNYIKFFENLEGEPENADLTKYSNMSAALLACFMRVIQRNKVQIDLHSQEGAANGLCVFLDSLGCDYIYKVFNNKYRRVVRCEKCNKDVSVDDDKSPIISIYKHYEFNNEDDFVKYLKNHMSFLDEYKCEGCGTAMKNIKRAEKLLMLREVITVVFKKNNAMFWFPEFLNFRSTGGNMLRYRLVSQIEHSGGYDEKSHTSSGHYWARVFRNGKWYNCNDSSVSLSGYQPTSNTHIIMYHMTEEGPMTAEEKIKYGA